MGVLRKYGMEVGSKVIEHRAYGQKIVEIVGGKAIHPVKGIPGGLSKPISQKQRQKIEKMARSCINFAEFSIKLYNDAILQEAEHKDLLFNKDFSMKSYDATLIDPDGNMNLYDGDIKITGPDGSTYARDWLTIYPSMGFIIPTKNCDECREIFEKCGLTVARTGVITSDKQVVLS